VIDWIRGLLTRRAPSTSEPDGLQGDLDPVALSTILGCRIDNQGLYRQALRHRSVLRGRPGAHMHTNERLEYLGDAVLGFLVAEHLYAEYPDKDEGFLTRLRAKLVNGRALAQRAREIELAPFLLVSDSLSHEQRGSDSILADAFEAIIGAIYLDQGMDSARAFIERTVLSHTDLDQLARVKDNFKSILLETVQAESPHQPKYTIVAETGPSHEKHFVVAVHVDGEEFGRGEGRSKKGAEQHAAREALARLSRRDS